MKAVEKSKHFNSRGAGRRLYRWIIDNFTLISDKLNTPASQKVWIELSKAYEVDILDIHTGNILKKNVDAELLKHNIWAERAKYGRDFGELVDLAGDIRLVVK